MYMLLVYASTCIHTISSLPTYSQYITYIQSVHYLHTVSTLPAYSQFISYALFVLLIYMTYINFITFLICLTNRETHVSVQLMEKYFTKRQHSRTHVERD